MPRNLTPRTNERVAHRTLAVRLDVDFVVPVEGVGAGGVWAEEGGRLLGVEELAKVLSRTKGRKCQR